MAIQLPDRCPRSRSDCEALARIDADDSSSFICMGENDGTTRTWPDDRFRLCVVSAADVDSTQDLDERDVADQLSVMAQAMSVVANGKQSDDPGVGSCMDTHIDGDCDNVGYLDALVERLGTEIHIAFAREAEGPGLTFIEIETPEGKSVGVGRWDDSNGRPVLVLPCLLPGKWGP